MRSAQNERRGELVVISHVVPRSHTGNAGQNYLSARVKHWMQSWGVRCILLPGLSAQTELDQALVPTHVLQAASPSAIRVRMGKRIRRTFPGIADPTVADALQNDPVARQWIRDADVVVLEWQEMGGHAGTIRRIAPHARIAAVLHDVVSQSIQRKRALAATVRDRLKLGLVHTAARRAEAWIVNNVDDVVVISQKDRGLLPEGKARIKVIPPAVSAPDKPQRNPEANRTIMVASWRPEDLTSLRWFLDEVLPIVEAHGLKPDIRLIGRMAEEYKPRWEHAPVTLEGFVPSITEAYEKAAVAIVPLKLGAGVKFKTVEAVLHEVPLVTTSIGAEGVTGLDDTSFVTDDPQSFAQRLISILTSPDAAESEARELAQQVRSHHSMAAFERAMDDWL